MMAGEEKRDGAAKMGTGTVDDEQSAPVKAERDEEVEGDRGERGGSKSGRRGEEGEREGDTGS